MEKKETKGINQVSEKRKEQMKLYVKEKKPNYLRSHPFCEICPRVMEYKAGGGKAKWWPKCGKVAVEIHHLEGRENDLLNKEESFMASCDSKKFNNGHNWLAQHSAAAMEIGIVISRHKVRKKSGVSDR